MKDPKNNNTRGKICGKCGKYKPYHEYDKANRANDGHTTDCTLCRGRRGVIKPKKDIVSLNQQLITMCEDFKVENAALINRVKNLESKLQDYQIVDQQKIASQLQESLDEQRKTIRG